MGEAFAEIEALSDFEQLEGMHAPGLPGGFARRHRHRRRRPASSGDDAARDVEALKEIERMLQESGHDLERTGPEPG